MTMEVAKMYVSCSCLFFVLTRYQKKEIRHFQKIYIPYTTEGFHILTPPPPALEIPKWVIPPCPWNSRLKLL